MGVTFCVECGTGIQLHTFFPLWLPCCPGVIYWIIHPFTTNFWCDLHHSSCLHRDVGLSLVLSSVLLVGLFVFFVVFFSMVGASLGPYSSSAKYLGPWIRISFMSFVHLNFPHNLKERERRMYLIKRDTCYNAWLSERSCLQEFASFLSFTERTAGEVTSLTGGAWERRCTALFLGALSISHFCPCPG